MAETPPLHGKAILIAGLTASGKSQLALDIAGRLNAAARGQGGGAVIINADSMQVYEGLRILTARPSAADEAKAPHYLYGFVPPETRFSVGAWLAAVAELLLAPELAGKTPIFVGGTGLYFRALLGGLADMPPISAAVRAEGQALLARGLPALYAVLAAADAQGAAALNHADTQRILRAWEVWRQTGRPLAEWQKNQPKPLINADEAVKMALLPPREQIYACINQRVDKMIEQGAAAEVAALNARGLDPQLPVMKAAGRAAFAAYLAGETNLAAAAARTKQETRNYAKRQRTWFSRQLDSDWQIYDSAAAAFAAWRGIGKIS